MPGAHTGGGGGGGGGGGMGMANPYMAAIGGALDIAGTFINAGEADERRKLYGDVANTPGLDFEAIASQALAGYGRLLPQAEAMSSKIATSNQAQLLAQEEMSLPGIGATRAKALQRIGGLFDDDAEWLRGVQRRGAALGLSSGLRGSQAGALQTLRLSDRESVARTQLGTGLLGSLIGSMRLANTPGVQAFLGPSISEQLNQRASERTQKMNIMLGQANLPTYAEVFGTRLQQVGGSMMGMGAQSATLPDGRLGTLPQPEPQTDYLGGMGGYNTYGGWNTPYFNADDAAAINTYHLNGY